MVAGIVQAERRCNLLNIGVLSFVKFALGLVLCQLQAQKKRRMFTTNGLAVVLTRDLTVSTS